MANTADEIYKRMRDDLTSQASRMDGSFSSDNLRSVANELGRLYAESYDQLIERAHISTATAEDLDAAAEEGHQMYRKEATKETVTLTLTGTPGTAVDSSMGAKAGDIVYMITGEYVIGVDGTVEAEAESRVAGAGYGVSAGEINQLLADYDGITAVTNAADSNGDGYDTETDDEFRARIIEAEKEIKGYGNNGWYRATAREVSGVARAKVIELARGKGTVDVVIIADGNTAAPQTLIDKVQGYIEEYRLAGADVLVSSGTPKEVAVAGSVYLQTGYMLSQVTDYFQEKLEDYLSDIDFDEETQARVSYARINSILSSCPGVADIGTLTVNDGMVSIELGAREFPVPGSISLEVV